MSAAAPVGCARCGTILASGFRFCPECGLPVSGDGVLSTEIAELRRRVEADSAAAHDSARFRYLIPIAAAAMLVFVVVLGLVLFNRALLNRLLPETPGGRAGAPLPAQPRWEPLWIDVPAGRFPYDDPGDGRVAEIPYSFKISKYEVPNALWLEFLRAERGRLADLWQEAFPRNVDGWTQDQHGDVHLAPESLRLYPVTGVSPVAIAEFCSWLTKRRNRPGEEIRIPTRLEWEFAARGNDGRVYPWGNDLLVTVPHAGTRRTRAGIDSAPRAVDEGALANDDTSPFGVVGMGTNVSEWTLMISMDPRSPDKPDDPDREDFSAFPPVSGLRDALEQQVPWLKVAWRGASFSTDSSNPALIPKAWSYTPDEPRDAPVSVGIRLVLVKVPK